MSSRVPIGITDFRKIRTDRLEYVDKTPLIRSLLDREGTQVFLLPRPRRFGKTLNLSMLRCFFEERDEDLWPLFEGLHIGEAADAYRAHFQRHPVIHLTFKDVKFRSFDRCWATLQRKISALFHEHRALLDSGTLSEWEAKDFRALLDGTASTESYNSALFDLSAYLHRRHGEQVVILIDEYDEPIHAGFVHGYEGDVIEFFRAFLTGGLKDNPHLYKAVLTGILRVARESIFSGLNNLAVYSLLRPEFNTCFGFTDPEVEALLRKAGRLDQLAAVRSWYNGYVFGGEVIYNPWSILSFIASEDALLRGYWVATSANDLVKELLERHALRLNTELETLLAGGAIERRLDENVVFSDLRRREEALWSLLVFSGYLRAEAVKGPPGEVPPYALSIPNREVREVYATTFQQWMTARLEGQGGSLERLTRALFGGDAEGLEEQLQRFVTDVLSYHDATRVDPERVYQAFVVGLLASLEPAYQVRSNRESGTGRPDVMIRPAQAGRPGAVLELKVAKAGKLDEALSEAVAQIEARDYGAELRASGAAPVREFAVAFDGKSVRAKAAGRERAQP